MQHPALEREAARVIEDKKTHAKQLSRAIGIRGSEGEKIMREGRSAFDLFYNSAEDEKGSTAGQFVEGMRAK